MGLALFVPLVNMIKQCSEMKLALLILLIFFFFFITNIYPFVYEINVFLKYRSDTIIGTLEILMSKISLKYISIHIHNFEDSRVIMNIKLSSHGFLFHININRRENKAQIPLIIHHNEKNQRIYFWCAAKDNWSFKIISEVALRKELEQWKFLFTPSGQKLILSNQHKMLWICLEEGMCLYRPNARWERELWPQLENCRK